MDRNEAKKVMAVIKAAYPTFYRDANGTTLSDAIDLWAIMFAEDNFNFVAAAVKSYIATDTKGFPPVIGQIKEKIRLLNKPKLTTEMEAWAMVKRAISNGSYHATKEYNKLPPEIQSVTTPDLLRDWALSDRSDEQVIASNFMRSYRAAIKRNEEVEALPLEVKKMFGMATKALPERE